MGNIETVPGKFLNTKYCMSIWTVRSDAGVSKIWVGVVNGEVIELPTAYADSDAKQMKKDIQAIMASW